MKLKFSLLVGAIITISAICPHGLRAQTTNLIDLNFQPINGQGSGSPASTNQTGAAVLGSAGDIWNGIGVNYYGNGSVVTTNLNFVNGSSTGLTFNLTDGTAGNNPGYGFNNTNGTSTDPGTTALMQQNAQIFSTGGNPLIWSSTISGLTSFAGDTFTLVVYAGAPAAATENLAITGGYSSLTSATNLTTTSTSRQLSAGIGVAYNTFTGTIGASGNLTWNVSQSGVGTYQVGDYYNGAQLELVTPPPAASYLWSNAPTSSNWATGANWAGGIVPASSSALDFDVSTITSLNNNITNATNASLNFTSNAPAYTIGGNTLTLSGTGPGIYNSSTNTQTITTAIVNPGGINLATTNGGGNLVINGGISGAGGVNATGPGTITLGGTNTYAGTTTIGASNNFDLTGSITNSSVTVTSANFNETTNGVIAGTASFSVAGSNSVVNLAGNNSFTGALTIPSGSVTLSGNNSGRPGTAGNTTILNGGALTLQANSNNTVGGISYALSQESSPNANSMAFTAGTLTLLSDSNVTFAGGNGMQIVTAGTTLNFDVDQVTSGNSNNTISFAPGGIATFANTTFNVKGSTNGYTLALPALTAFNGAGPGYENLTLNANGANFQIGGLTSAGTLTVGGSGNTTFSGAITGGSVTMNGAGTLTLGGTNTYTGTTLANSGTVVLTGTLSNSAISVQGGNFLEGTTTIAGTTGVTIGSGTATLTGANTYSGETTISGGALNLQNLDVVSTLGTGTLTVSGGTVDLGGGLLTNILVSSGGTIQDGAITNSGAYTLQGGTIIADLQGTNGLTMNGTNNTLTLVGAKSLTGGLTVTAGTLAGDTTSLTGDITDNGNLDFVMTNDGTYTPVSTGISGTGSVSVDGNGTAVLTLAGSNGYSGGTIVNTNGILLIQTTSSIGSGTLTVAGGTANLNGLTITNGFSASGGLVTNGTILGNGGSFSVSGGTIGAVLAGSNSLTINDPNTVTLTVTNTYSGGTFATGGTLDLTSGGTIGSGTLSVSGDAVVDLGGGLLTNALSMSAGTIQNGSITNAGPYVLQGGTINAVLKGTQGLTMNGVSNTLTLVGPQSYTGGTTVSAGTLAGDTTSLQGAISNNGTLDFVQTTNGSYTGSGISGTGQVLADGSATLTLGGSNSYTGGTVVTNNGSLQVTSASAIGSGTLTAAGGTLDLGGLTITNGFSASQGVVQNGTISNNSGTFALNGGEIDVTLAGSNSVTIGGPGTVILTGNNTYTGGTFATNGTLNLVGTGSLGSGQLSISGNETVVDLGGNTYTNTLAMSGGLLQDGTITNAGTYNLQGGTIDTSTTLEGSHGLIKSGVGTLTLNGPQIYTGGTTISSGTLAGDTTSLTGDIVNNGSIDFVMTTNGTYSGTSNGITGTGSLIADGSATLTLGGSNSYSGGTVVTNNGALQLTSTQNIGSGTVSVGGGTLNLGGLTITNAFTASGGDVTNGTINNPNGYILQGGEIDAVLAGSGSLTVAGPGTVILTQSNTYSGGTYATGGTLDLTNGGTLGSGPLTISGATVDLGGGTLSTLAAMSGGTLQNGTLTNSGAYVLQGGTISANIQGSNGLTMNGVSNTLTLSGSNSYIGGNTVSAGTLAFVGSNAIGNNSLTITGTGTADLGGAFFTNAYSVGDNATIQNGTLTNVGAYNLTGGTYNVTLEGGFGLTKSGAGTLTLGGNNTYVGGTIINSGTVAANNGNSFSAGAVLFASNSVLTTTSPNSVILNNNFTIASGATVNVNAGSVSTNAQHEIVFNEYGGSISGPGALSLTADAFNILTFVGADSYSGGTTLNGGRIQIFNNSAFGTGPITVASNSTLRADGFTTPNATVVDSGTTLTLSNPTSATGYNYSGVISGPGSLYVAAVPGSTVTLSASDTYTGTTTISSGTLVLGSGASINDSTNINLGTAASQGTLDMSTNSFYTLGTNQTLSGYGAIKAPSTLLTVNGNITPGSIDGTTRGLITVNGNLSLASTAVTTLTLISTNGGAGSGYDGLKITGSLQFNGQLNLVVNNAPMVGVFNLFGANTYTKGLTGVALAGSWSPGSFMGINGLWNYTDHTYDWVFSESTGNLTVSLVPEPSTWALIGLSLIIGVVMRRKFIRKESNLA